MGSFECGYSKENMEFMGLPDCRSRSISPFGLSTRPILARVGRGFGTRWRGRKDDEVNRGITSGESFGWAKGVYRVSTRIGAVKRTDDVAFEGSPYAMIYHGEDDCTLTAS